MDKTERKREEEREKEERKKNERVMLLEAFIEVYSLFLDMTKI